jgi:CheY-like chemotaxis protein
MRRLRFNLFQSNIKDPIPDIIFPDLNMRLMDGFEVILIEPDCAH